MTQGDPSLLTHPEHKQATCLCRTCDGDKQKYLDNFSRFQYCGKIQNVAISVEKECKEHLGPLVSYTFGMHGTICTAGDKRRHVKKLCNFSHHSRMLSREIVVIHGEEQAKTLPK